MKSLLIKEIRLASMPLTYIFLLFTGMTMIPGYPILVGSFFVCFGIFQSFQSAREANDVLYTVLLPVGKGEAVRAKYVFVCAVQTAAWLVMAALTVLRMTALRGAASYVNNVMMNANPVYLGYAALVFALFDTVFVGLFFKTAYKFGKPFVLFAVFAMLLIGIAETLHHIPGIEFLNSMEQLPLQAGIMTACLFVWVASAALSYRRAKRDFEQLDF